MQNLTRMCFAESIRDFRDGHQIIFSPEFEDADQIV
jgi:hypothetical protein